MSNTHPEILRQAKALLAQGVLTLPQIANRLGINHKTLWRWKTKGFPSQCGHLELVGVDHGRCRLCGEVKPLDQFLLFMRNSHARSAYRLSYCTPCRNARARERIHGTLDAKLRNRVQVLRGACASEKS